MVVYLVYLDPTFIKKTRFDRQEKKMDPDPTLEKHPDPQPLSGPGWSLPGSELYKKKTGPDPTLEKQPDLQTLAETVWMVQIVVEINF